MAMKYPWHDIVSWRGIVVQGNGPVAEQSVTIDSNEFWKNGDPITEFGRYTTTHAELNYTTTWSWTKAKQVAPGQIIDEVYINDMPFSVPVSGTVRFRSSSDLSDYFQRPILSGNERYDRSLAQFSTPVFFTVTPRLLTYFKPGFILPNTVIATIRDWTFQLVDGSGLGHYLKSDQTFNYPTSFVPIGPEPGSDPWPYRASVPHNAFYFFVRFDDAMV